MNAHITWTKQTLTHALNSRMDQGKLGGNDFIMPNEITDDALAAWQEFYDANQSNPLVIEGEYKAFYQSIVAGF